MRAVHIVNQEGPAHLRQVEVEVPARAPDEVRIRVAAAGVSFPELLQSKGLYQLQPELPFIPGGEVAGTVVEAPAGSRHQVGDRVAAVAVSGGYAEVATAKEHMVFPLPDGISFEKAAALPVNYLTCHFALTVRAALQAGERVLVHGAAGGVGNAAIQVAKAFGAGLVVAVVSTDEKEAVALRAGADECVRPAGFLARAKELGGVDVVVDPVGGDRFTDSLRALREDGRVVVVGFAGGEIPTVRVNRLLLNNISVVGAGLGAYTATREGYEAEQWDELLPHLRSGVLDPPAVRAFALEQASHVLSEIEARQLVGKAVLVPGA